MKFDGIISSISMDHVKDTQAMFNDFYRMLNDNGVIAVADLDIEDGSFHTDDTGVFHLGFDRTTFLNKAIAAGLRMLESPNRKIDEKPQGKYPVFLLTGNK